MKKIILTAASLMLSAVLCFGAAAGVHTVTTPYNWYFNKTTGHSQPCLNSDMKFIENYDAYYVDKNADENDKVIYLTFDLGYVNDNVISILDTLKAHNAHGAFFILENVVCRNLDITCRLSDEGHLVCNHTARHPDMSAITDRKLFEKQLNQLSDLYFMKTCRKMDMFYRPPCGRFSEQNLQYLQDMGYSTIFWSFAYADWENNKQPDPKSSIDKILAGTHNGMVILLHPTSATNAAILDTLLTSWESQGYRFGTLNELTDNA